MNTDLTSKNALVCGGSRGIGKAIAIELANLACNITLVARSAEMLSELSETLDRSRGQNHDFLVSDFSNSADLTKKIRGLSISKPIHILINNTGGPPSGPILNAKPEEFQTAFHNHLIVNHLLTTLLSPGMIREGYGRIVNVVSTSVKEPIPGLGVSNTTRAAVAGWAKTMAGELGIHGITVNNILPGFTRTERLESLIESWAGARGITPSEMEEELKKIIPLGRFADPSELGAVAAFLCTPAAAYINGVSLAVDGGRTKSI
ncbi:MAG: SDR family oxidoreductase [Saprospiraceae bacterium]|nr:SDR family oxidoreductase [Saprospiraceae bacterium]